MSADKNIAEIFTRPNAEARIHDLDQFTLWTDTPNRPGYRSRMNFSERNGMPRISVFTNIDGVQPMWIGLDPVSFNRFLDRFEEIAKGPNGVSDKIENKGVNPALAGQRKGMPKEEDLVVRNILKFGKSSRGCAGSASNRPASRTSASSSNNRCGMSSTKLMARPSRRKKARPSIPWLSSKPCAKSSHAGPAGLGCRPNGIRTKSRPRKPAPLRRRSRPSMTT